MNAKKEKAVSMVRALNKRIGIVASISFVVVVLCSSFEIINVSRCLPLIISTIVILAINAGLIIFYDTCIFKLCKKYHIYKY